MSDPQTPTELLIDRLEDVDDVTAAFVLFRRKDGTISYRSVCMDSAELLGFLRFTQLSVEHELVDGWKE